MSTESKNKWRRLHELCLRVKEAKDFETLGAVVEELSELKTAEGDAAKFGNGQCFSAISNAYIAAWKKLGQWQENPPPIAPQETQIAPAQEKNTEPRIMFSSAELHALITRCTQSSSVDPDAVWQWMRPEGRERWGKALGELNLVFRSLLIPQIGPGNPFPPPPPPPPTVAGENTNAMLQEYISIDELKERVQDVLRPFVVSIRDARIINGYFARESMNLISERIEGVFSNVDAKPPTVAPGGWTGALVFERIAPKGLANPVGYRAATPEEQAELDRMARAINRNTPLFDPTPQAPGSLDALNAKAIERAAEPVKTPEPWTVDRLKLIFDEHDTIFDLDDDVADLIVSIFNDENNKRGKAMGHSTHAAEFPKPWTGDELYEAFRQAVWGAGKKEDWQRFSDSVRDDFLMLAMLVNQRMGIIAQ